MAPHSSTLAWKIPWTEEAGGLQSMESLRVGHDWATSLSLFTFMHWRRQWQPTPVFLPGGSQGRGSLVGCRLWCCTELDTTEATQQQQQQQREQMTPARPIRIQGTWILTPRHKNGKWLERMALDNGVKQRSPLTVSPRSSEAHWLLLFRWDTPYVFQQIPYFD